jgi:hypothetical protein
MKENYDAIVVGGGIGGLITAGLLSKRGLKTLIVEKAPAVAGTSRVMEWGGFRADMIAKVQTAYFAKPEDTWLYRALKMIGVTPDLDTVERYLMAIGKKGQVKPEIALFDTGAGSDALIDLHSIMTGFELNTKQKTELERVLTEMGTISEETSKEFLGMGFKEWSEKNVGDIVIQMFFLGTTLLAGLDPSDFAAGHMMGAMGPIHRGSFCFALPRGALMEDGLIAPLAKAVEQLGCETITNTTVKKIIIEDNTVEGVWIIDNNTMLSYRITAPIVVSAVPIYHAFGRFLEEKDFTESELRFVNMIMNCQQEDYWGVYFLKEKVVPEDFPAWSHIFDFRTGGPVYLGDLWIPLGAKQWLGATGPEGKQLVIMYMVGGSEGHFEEDYPSYKTLTEEASKFESIIDSEILPGFLKAVEHKGHLLIEGWGRFNYFTHDPNDTLEVKSKAVKGLYFAGDTPFVLGSLLGLEKCGRVGIECADAITRDLGRS